MSMHDMLDVIEHQQDALVRERSNKRGKRWLIARQWDFQCCCDGWQHEVGIIKRREINEPDPVRKIACSLAGHHQS